MPSSFCAAAPPSEETLSELQRTGSCRIAWPQSASLAGLGKLLGLVIYERAVLESRPSEQARPQTLSSRFGLGAFPWHTDAAQQPRPPGLLLLRCLAETSTPTALLDAHTLSAAAAGLRRRLRRGVWAVRGGRHPFYAPVIDDRGRLRYNPLVMTPATVASAATQAQLAHALAQHEGQEHHWAPGEALLVDNTRMLHRRPAMASPEHRQLERIFCEHPDRLGP